MKLLISISEEKYEWIKKNNPNADPNSIVGAIANGIPIKTVTNAEEAEAYPINQEENCKIVREFLRDIANIKDLPLCKECRTCIHCMLGKKKLPKIVWMNGNPFIFCTRHHEHFAPDDTCEFWRRGEEK